MRNVFYIKFCLTLLLLLFFKEDIKAQLDKKTWIVGGASNLYLSNRNYISYVSSATNRKSNEIQLVALPNIGHFLADKFALGIKPYFSWGYGKVENIDIHSNSKRYGLGPFARFYFLDKNKSYNLLTDITYQIGIWDEGGKGKLSNFSISLGSVVYFNSSVGLEFLLGYSAYSEELKEFSKNVSKGINANVSFQIHLIK